MKTLFCIMLLAGLPNSIPDGTIIATEHSKKLVERVSSPITHVGIIFSHNEIPYVYEAIPPAVHKVPLEQYYKELGERRQKNPDLVFWIAIPNVLFSDREIRSMQSFADSQIGRRYSIKGYTRGNPDIGPHCAQFVCDVLTRSRRFWSENSGIVTPESLWESIEKKFTKHKIDLPK